MRPRAGLAVAATTAALMLAACSGGNQPGAGPPGPAASAPRSDAATSAAASPTSVPATSASAGTAAPTATVGPSSAAPKKPSAASTPAPAHGSVRVVRTVASGLNVPWGLALLGDHELLVTSRDSRVITRIDLKTGRKTILGEISEARSNGSQGGEGGLLGLALSPRFDHDHELYLYYSTDSDNRIARVSYDQGAGAGHQLSKLQVIVKGIPHGIHHNGGRIAFGPDGMLWATTGESGVPQLAQDKHSLGGKILRMTPTGAPAPGNPDPGSLMWSYGHRNVQGLAWDPAGRLWASEFGDREFDELNLIKKDHNYGWPATQGRTDITKYTSPVAQWGTEEDSPSGIAYAGGSIWMAALKGERLWRIPLNGDRTAGRPEAFLHDRYGRLRSVLALDDRTLLVTTSNTDGRGVPAAGDDRILELRVR